jgi:hypothetical protein
VHSTKIISSRDVLSGAAGKHVSKWHSSCQQEVHMKMFSCVRSCGIGPVLLLNVLGECCQLTARLQASADEVAFILDAISDFLQIKVHGVHVDCH